MQAAITRVRALTILRLTILRLVTRKASGITSVTSNIPRLGDFDAYEQSKDQPERRSKPKIQRSEAPPPAPSVHRAPAAPPPPAAHAGGSWEEVLRERNYLSSHMPVSCLA